MKYRLAFFRLQNVHLKQITITSELILYSEISEFIKFLIYTTSNGKSISVSTSDITSCLIYVPHTSLSITEKIYSYINCYYKNLQTTKTVSVHNHCDVENVMIVHLNF